MRSLVTVAVLLFTASAARAEAPYMAVEATAAGSAHGGGVGVEARRNSGHLDYGVAVQAGIGMAAVGHVGVSFQPIPEIGFVLAAELGHHRIDLYPDAGMGGPEGSASVSFAGARAELRLRGGDEGLYTSLGGFWRQDLHDDVADVTTIPAGSYLGSPVYDATMTQTTQETYEARGSFGLRVGIGYRF